MTPLVIIPARTGSKGVPNKNFQPLYGLTLVERAVECAVDAGLSNIAISTDAKAEWWPPPPARRWARPPALAGDTAPMLEVVKDVLRFFDGDPVVLLQPSSPLRTPQHLREVLELLPGVDSVVSVCEIPQVYSPDLVWRIGGAGLLQPFITLAPPCARRQDARRAYVRDGTVYAFWRRNVEVDDTLYGARCLPFVIPPEESLSIDTPEDWTRAEQIIWAQHQRVLEAMKLWPEDKTPPTAGN